MIKPVSLNQSRNTSKPLAWQCKLCRERVGCRNIFLDFNASPLSPRAGLVPELSQVFRSNNKKMFSAFIQDYIFYGRGKNEFVHIAQTSTTTVYLPFYTSSVLYLPSPDYFIGNNHIYTRLMPLRQRWKKPINAITKPCNSNIFTTLVPVMLFIFDVQMFKRQWREN